MKLGRVSGKISDHISRLEATRCERARFGRRVSDCELGTASFGLTGKRLGDHPSHSEVQTDIRAALMKNPPPESTKKVGSLGEGGLPPGPESCLCFIG